MSANEALIQATGGFISAPLALVSGPQDSTTNGH
jgi:hypothetical protein